MQERQQAEARRRGGTLHLVEAAGRGHRGQDAPVGVVTLGRVGNHVLAQAKPHAAQLVVERPRAHRVDLAFVPEPEQQRELHRIIFHELCQGQFLATSKAYYLQVIERCRQRGAEGVILGCTEIPLLVGPQDLPGLPQFDTAALHVAAAVDWALGDSSAES